jgi:hypothetical protein
MSKSRRCAKPSKGQLAKTNDTAKEMARNELCRALAERLQLAESEAAELAELVVIARKS